jgi:tRNA threonylcarbamoyl adenosine modification protein YeaZ
MTTLAIDSNADTIFVGIRTIKNLIVCKTYALEKNFNTNALDILHNFLEMHAENKKINLVIYNKGPGSFTSIRMLAAMSQAIALANNSSILGISSFEMHAKNAFLKIENTMQIKPSIALVLIKANETFFYFAKVENNKETLKTIDMLRIEKDDIPEQNLSWIACGDGWKHIEKNSPKWKNCNFSSVLLNVEKPKTLLELDSHPSKNKAPNEICELIYI